MDIDLDETLLSFGAMIFELGLPVFLAFIYRYSPKNRPVIVTVISSLMPFICVYIFFLIESIVEQTAEVGWAAGAIWVMSFFVYITTAIFSFILGLILPKNIKTWLRAILGLFSGPIALVILNLLPL